MEFALERLKENGAYANEALYLTQIKSYSFGQMSHNDFVSYAPTVENKHCIFHNEPNGLFVEVVKSSPGGLKVNGKKYSTRSVIRLNNNDIVNIGLLLKYKVKMKAAIPLADNTIHNYVKSENDEEDPYQNVNDSDVENLENEETTLITETFQSKISQKEKKHLSKNKSDFSQQEIDGAIKIEIEKKENEFEDFLSYDSSAEIMSYHSSAAEISFDSSDWESYYSPSESKSPHEFGKEAASDFSFEREYLSDQYSLDSLTEGEALSDSLSEKLHLPVSSKDDKLSNSSSKEKIPSSTQHSLLSLIKRVPCLKIEKLSSAFLEEKNLSSVSKTKLSSESKKPLSTKSSQKKPKSTKPSGKSFKCEFCDKLFSRKLSLNNHLLSHEYDVRFSSTDKAFLKQQRLQTQQPYGCDQCDKRFKSKIAISQHIKKTHPGEKQQHPPSQSTEKEFKCSICPKDFVRKYHLEQHLLIHSTEKKFKCSDCEKSFRRKDHLQGHMLSHSTENRYECSLCEKSFGRKYCLRQHMQIHSTEKKFKCSVCEKGFVRKYHLQQHMLSHSVERNFQCSHCERSFRRKQHLQDHMLTHFTEKKFQCSFCKKEFGRKYCLKQHMLMHTTDENVKCPLCKRDFGRIEYLKRHMLVHSTERKFKCTHCEKSFKSKSNLRNHVKTMHTRDQLFKCKFCDRDFLMRKRCEDHERGHLGEKPYSCKPCGKDFQLLSSLKRHKKKQH